MSTGVCVPPQDLDVERALLGALMLDPNVAYEVADTVHADAFYAPKHRTIYEAMLSLHQKNEPIDLVTVSARLKEQKGLQDVGGAAYLSELASAAASAGSARHYASVVQSKSILRLLIEAAARIHDLGFEESRDVEQVIDEAQQVIYAVSNRTSSRAFSAIREELTAAWERLENLQKHDDTLRGVPTGFRALDSLLSGLQKSDLIILAARPSMGKTTLGLDIARQTAIKHKTPVGFFSLEMSSQQLVDRMLAAQAGVNSWKLRTGRIKNDQDFERLQHGLEELSEAPIYIDDKSSNSVLAMRSIARRMKSEKGLGLIVIDYLQLILPSVQGANVSMVQQVTEISRSLKGLARELDVPVLALSQLSRAVEQRGGRPRLSDLRDSGSIEQDADVVMFIHREDMMGNRTTNEKNNVAEILVEKHRNGPVGKVDLLFDEESTTFKTLEKADFGDYSQAAVSSAGDPF
jgi:replicative DNA helicase